MFAKCAAIALAVALLLELLPASGSAPLVDVARARQTAAPDAPASADATTATLAACR